jgi:hypothetical protein
VARIFSNAVLATNTSLPLLINLTTMLSSPLNLDPRIENGFVDPYLRSPAPREMWSTPFTFTNSSGFLYYIAPDLSITNGSFGRWSSIIDGQIGDDFVLLSARSAEDDSVWLLYASVEQFRSNGIVAPVFRQAICSSFTRSIAIDGFASPFTGIIAKSVKVRQMDGSYRIVALVDSEQGWVVLSWNSENPQGILAWPSEFSTFQVLTSTV